VRKLEEEGEVKLSELKRGMGKMVEWRDKEKRIGVVGRWWRLINAVKR
jgi:hypothetical protein